MAVDFGGVKMQNPINTAAGTFGYGWQFQNFFDVSQLGAITTKGCAAEPWPGNPAPRMAEIPGGMINSVGLQNPGVAAFARESGPWLEQLSKDGCQVICQVAGHSVDEFVRALEMYVELCPWAAGYEINVSCPNIAAGGAAEAVILDHQQRVALVDLGGLKNLVECEPAADEQGQHEPVPSRDAHPQEIFHVYALFDFGGIVIVLLHDLLVV